MDDGARARHEVSQQGILPRILRSWWAPGRVVRELRGMPDRVLIVVLIAAMLIYLIAQLPVHAHDAQIDPSIPLQARIGGALLATMFMMPLFAYLLAAIVAGIAHLLRVPLSPHDSRLALFWALLAVSPAMLLSGLTQALAGPGPALTLVHAIAGIAFLLIWGAGLRSLATK